MDLKEIKSGLDKNTFWHRAKLELIEVLMSKLGKRKASILNVGAGDGSDLRILKKFGDVTIIDIDQEVIDYIPDKLCREKRLCNAENITFKDNTFDVVVAFDVLEHIKNDKKAIEECTRVVKKGGYLVITVPAYQWMFSKYDEMLGHHRRYEKKEFKDKFRKLDEVYFTYWNFALLLPMALERLMRKGSYSIKKFSPLQNTIGYFILTKENFLIQKKMKFMTGGSICAIYQKR